MCMATETFFVLAFRWKRPKRMTDDKLADAGVGVSAWRRGGRGGVSYPEGVSGLSPGWRLCGTLGYIIESETL